MSEPTEFLINDYNEKTENAIIIMENARRIIDSAGREGVAEWVLSASYYAKYFAVYTILVMLGVTSKSQKCTIALFEYLFKDDISNKLFVELKTSKKNRVATQYEPMTHHYNLEDVATRTREYVDAIRQLRESLTRQRLAEIKYKLDKLYATL